ncbi:filamentous hemagglutinin N-terminal domain-containing protein [Pleurocapsa sp. PCC 7319]|uniref:two-partner secretion domain-containing protein n=1 Tax=Pleurocapsa sp. PCC 7319 TaxID=118161 RepID=UPI000349F442|nr:filamentous hemagglutinin N-terminal domain-containing protein [Pleurocapsa sp. PCC 7319]
MSIINNICGAGVVLTTCFLFASIGNAQPVPDVTLPNNSEVNLEDRTYQISGGTVAGENLFHSFESFSVPIGTETIFNNNLAIQNILTRVTGNSVSNIDGLLGTMGSANLFFLNPNGVIFGSNSSLDIGGSFITTTADSLQFEDGIEFSASNPQTSPLLTISIPVGLQFGSQVGDISIQAASLDLGLNQLKTFALVGGNFNLEGGSIFADGNIELGSVARNSQVNLIPIETGWTLDYENVENFQDISFGQAATAEDRALEFPVALFTNKLQIQGKNISLLAGKQFIILQNASISASDTLKISGSNQETAQIAGDAPNFSQITGESADENNGGDLLIDTDRLIIRDGGQITSQVSGTFNLDGTDITPATGNGGDVIINASESIELVDEDSGIFSSSAGFGLAGKITINTKDLSISNGAIITAESTGADLVGRAIATGLGGEIEINASESIRLNGGFISSSTSGLGDDAGSLSLKTDRLSILDGSEISVSASGSGLAGNLEITANSINLDRSSLNAETRVGDRGNITLNNTDTLLLRNNSQITTNAAESATGGDITISSEGIALLDNSDITAKAVRGQGGNIQITTQGIFQEPDSEITAASELGIDGTITINNPDVDPASGVFELSDIPVDAEAILAQDICKFQDEKIAKGSSFIITGRGGLTPTSEESLGNRDRIVNWASRDDLEVSKNGAVGIRQRAEKESVNKKYPEIKQSQGLVVASDGSKWLTANAPNTILQNFPTVHPDCQS